jgi:hypothetical protein
VTWDWPKGVKEAALRSARKAHGAGANGVIPLEDLEQEALIYLATHPAYLDYKPSARAFAIEKHLIRLIKRERVKQEREASVQDEVGLEAKLW